MKTKIISLLIIFTSQAAIAQLSGKVTYEERRKLDINIDSDDEQEIANIPKEHVTSRELIFDSTASLFRSVSKKNADEEITNEVEHGKMVLRMDEPDEKMYCDLVGKKRIEQREFMSRKFLIEIPFSASTWKLTGKQKKILNYTCSEAVLQDTARQVTAWFTSEIPVSTGPYGVCNLPGLVLAAEFRGGEQTYEAKAIELTTVDKKQIVKPTEGKKVSRDEFNSIVKEKMEEMREQNGGDGNVIIRIKK